MEERVYLAYRWQSITNGTQGRNSRQEVKKKPIDKCYLLACVFWFAQLPFLHSLGPPVQNCTAHSVLGLSVINHHSSIIIKTNLMETILQLSFPLPKCVKCTTKISHHTQLNLKYTPRHSQRWYEIKLIVTTHHYSTMSLSKSLGFGVVHYVRVSLHNQTSL